MSEKETSTPQSYEVEWEVSWGDLSPVRVWAQYFYRARGEGAKLLNQKHVQVLLDRKVTLGEMDVSAVFAFKPQQLSSPGYIIDTVCDYFGIEVEAVLGRTRSATVAKARNFAMYLSKVLTDLSLNEIADQFERSHTTVMSAVKMVQRTIDGADKQPAYRPAREQLKELRRKFPQ